MKKIIKENLLAIVLIVTIIFVISVVSVLSKGKKTSITDQQNCSKKSDEMFQDYKNKMDDYALADNSNNYEHRNHYSSKMNGCFVLFETDTNYDAHLELYNAYENNKVGDLTETRPDNGIVMCWVSNSDKQCKDYSEFSSLIKPYMEN
jgi:hypothetical protein